jgi:hypothetical protein
MQKFFFSLLVILLGFSGSTRLPAEAPVYSHTGSFSACALPAPSWLNVTGATSSTVSVAWNNVGGAAMYRVKVTNITQGISYPEVLTTSTSYTRTGLSPLDVVEFNVSASSCSTFNPDETYPEISVEGQTTRIVIEDIAQFNGNVNPSNAVYNFSVGSTLTLPMMQTNSNAIQYRLVKITSPAGSKGGTIVYTTIFAIWADCNRKVHVVTMETTNLQAVDLTLLVPSTVNYGAGDGGGGATHVSISNPVTSGTNMIVDISTISNTYTKVMTALATGTQSDYCFIGGDGLVINDDQEWTAEAQSIRPERGGNAPADRSLATATELQITPNPFEEQIRLNFQLSAAGPVSVTLLDATGRAMRHLEISAMEAGVQQLILPTESLPKGMYFIALQTEAGRETKTLIKQ